MKPYTPEELKKKLKGHLPGTVKMSHVTDTCELCRWGSTLAETEPLKKEVQHVEVQHTLYRGMGKVLEETQAEVERLRGLLDENEAEAHRLIRWRREAEADAARLREALRGSLSHSHEDGRCALCDKARAALAGSPVETRREDK